MYAPLLVAHKAFTHARFAAAVLVRGVKKEKLLFWIFTILGTVLAAALLVIYYTRNY
mgnify:CR=1 FL=1